MTGCPAPVPAPDYLHQGSEGRDLGPENVFNARSKISGFRSPFEQNGRDVIASLPVASLANWPTDQPVN